MAKIKLQGNASGTGVLTVTAPNTSTDRTITLPDSTGTILDNTSTLDATKLSGTLPALNGSSLTGIAGRKNMVINGAMQINQRGTTATGGSTALHYGACDRWRMYQENTSAAYTLSQDSNSPDGFGSSYKVDVTTADSTLDATDRVDLLYRFEGNELQHLKKGTASAESVTLSFWVSSPKTGTHIIEFYDNDNSRAIHKAYTISAANTWEHKTILIEGDTTGAFDNDNNLSLQFNFWLMAGSNFTSGTLDTSWGSVTTANRAVGQVNVMDSTSNNFYLTGVQLELGSTATDFEHRSFGEELAACKRYYQSSGTMQYLSVVRWQGGVGNGLQWYQFQNEMRAAPTMSISGGWTTGSKFTTPSQWDVITTKGAQLEGNVSQGLSEIFYAHDGTIYMDAEL